MADASPGPSPAWEALEKALADGYRRELEHEENLWRSLPFFAAALALQFAALVPLLDRLAALPAPLGDLARVLAGAAGLLTLWALLELFGSLAVGRDSYRYVASEGAMLGLARALEASRAAVADPEAALRQIMMEQYAAAADHNRAVNRRRTDRRTRAALATLASLLATLGLVGSVLAHQMLGR